MPSISRKICTPQDNVEWAAYAVCRKRGPSSDNAPAKRPVEDRCLKCDNFWAKVLRPLGMSWERYCEIMEQEDWKGEILAAIERGSSPPPDYRQNTVSGIQITGTGFKLEVPFLTKPDFTEYMEISPEDAKVQCVTAVGPFGDEKGYMVRDDKREVIKNYNRKIEIFGKVVLRTEDPKMLAKEHVFPKMTSLVLSAEMAKRQDNKIVGKTPESVPILTASQIFKRKDDLERKLRASPPAGHDEDLVSHDGQDHSDGEPPFEVVRSRAEGNDEIPPATRLSTKTKRPSAGSSVPADAMSAVGGTESAWGDADFTIAGRNKTLEHWKNTLNLLDILNGKKMGREEGFAERALQRMDAATPGDGNTTASGSPASELRAHLFLVVCCKKCTITSINSSSLAQKELDDSLEPLKKAGVVFSVKHQCALTNRAYKNNLADAKEAKRHAVQLAFKIVVPWTPSQDDVFEFDPLCPRVHAMDLPDKEKAAWFTNMTLKILLLPVVQQGADGSEKVYGICYQMSECIGAFLPENMCSQEFDEATTEILTICQFFTGLGDPEYIGRDVQDFMQSSGTGIKKTFHEAVVSDPFWSGQVKEFDKFAPSHLTHGDRFLGLIMKIKTFPIEDSVPTKTLLDLCSLMEDLLPRFRPQAFCKVSDTFLGRVGRHVELRHEAALKANDFSDLAELVTKAIKLWPRQADTLRKYEASLADASSKARQQERKDLFVVRMKNVVGSADNIEHVIDETRDGLDSVRGLSDVGGREECAEVVKALLGFAGADYLEDVDLRKRAVSAASKMVEFLLGNEEKDEFTRHRNSCRILEAGWEVHKDLNDFFHLGDTTQARVNADSKGYYIGMLLAARATLNAFLKTPHDGDCVAPVLNVLAQAEEAIKTTGVFATRRSRSGLLNAVVDLSHIAKGMPGGKDWLEGAPDDWTPLVAHAKETIMKINSQQLLNKITAVEQAS